MASTWTYRTDLRRDTDSFVDFDVEATDGGIGKIVEESFDVDASHLVVDTGFWIFGTKRLIPAGVVSRVDYDGETVYIDMTKDQVKESPEFAPRDTVANTDPDNYRRPYIDYYAGWPWM